jgi:hypothetical protein
MMISFLPVIREIVEREMTPCDDFGSQFRVLEAIESKFSNGVSRRFDSCEDAKAQRDIVPGENNPLRSKRYIPRISTALPFDLSFASSRLRVTNSSTGRGLDCPST